MELNDKASTTLNSVHGGHAVTNQWHSSWSTGRELMLSDPQSLSRQTGRLRLAHLAMRTGRPEAHKPGRPQELAEQRSPSPPVQEPELGHRAAGGRDSGQKT